MKAGNGRHVYDALKSLTKFSQPMAAVFDDKEDNLLTCSDEALKRLTEYCESLCNCELHPYLSICKPTRSSQKVGTVEAAMRSLKTCKSPRVNVFTQNC